MEFSKRVIDLYHEMIRKLYKEVNIFAGNIQYNYFCSPILESVLNYCIFYDEIEKVARMITGRFFASEAAEPSAVIIFRPNNFAVQKYVSTFAQTNKKTT